MDVNVEIRGPKGWGKSAFALAIARSLVPGFNDLTSLVYSHSDYAGRYRSIRSDRQCGDRGVKFIWVDDAARIFDKRAHMTKKNRAMLTLNRTMRSQLGAVQILLTQDDLLEKPLREGGNYVLFILDRPYHAYNYWLKNDPLYKSEPKLIRGFPTTWADPNVSYPGLWEDYRRVRERMTDDLTEELLKDIAPTKRPSPREYGVKRDAILAAVASGKKKAEVARLFGLSKARVGQIVQEARQRDSKAPGSDSAIQGGLSPVVSGDASTGLPSGL